jgi:hypothetical protein
MRLLLLFLFVVVACCCGLCQANFEELTLTPFGYMPKSCVHHVGDFGHVSLTSLDELKVTLADGSSTVLPRCHSLAHLAARQERLKQAGATGETVTATLPNGWAAYTYYGPHAPFDFFGGDWAVPNNPKEQKVQTLFLFTGFQNDYLADSPNAVVSIIQPVLQWGPSEAGGGNYWSIASWFVSSNGQAVYSTLKKVSAGERITGNMTLVGQKWDIVAVGSSGASSGISVNPGATETYAFVTLEVYGVDDCGEYPNGSTLFKNLLLTSTKRKVVPTWNVQTQPGCGEAVTVLSPSQVRIKF